MWIVLSVVLAVGVYSVWMELRRISRVLAGIGLILERVGNRAADRLGDPPVLTPDDARLFK